MKKGRKNKLEATPDGLLELLNRTDDRGLTINQISEAFDLTEMQARLKLCKRIDHWHTRHSDIEGVTYYVHNRHGVRSFRA